MIRALALLGLLAALAACNPVRTAGDVVVGAGQVALGAVDLVL
jgi:hypothetical protein